MALNSGARLHGLNAAQSALESKNSNTRKSEKGGLLLPRSVAPALLTWGATESSRASNPHSDLLGLKQTKDTHHEERKAETERHGQGIRRRSDRVALNSLSSYDSFSEYAANERVDGRTERHKNTIHDPSEKYARRPRHKAKANRYDYKDLPEERSQKRQSKISVKKKPGAILNDEFQAPSIAAERLTLRSMSSGFLAKGKSSANADWKGLPDLTFSEMAFLKRKREDDNARFQKTREQKRMEKSRKPPDQEISEFFSRPSDSKHEATSIPKQSSAESHVSWSISPPRRRAASTGQRLNFVAQSRERGTMHMDERDNLSVPTSVRPNSSVSNRFLKDFTTAALLRGVCKFAPREKKYYSLEDLKKLAVEALPDVPSSKEPPDDCALRNADRTRIPSQPSINPMAQRGASPSEAVAEPQQESHGTAVPYNFPNTGVQSSHHSNDEQPPPLQASTRDIKKLRTTRLKEHGADRTPSYAPSFFELPIGLRYHDESVWEDEGEELGLSYRARQIPGRLENAELSGYTGGDLGLGKHDAENVQPQLPPPGASAVAGHSVEERQAFEAVAPFCGELDEFDRMLLRQGTEYFAPSDSVAMIDRDVHLHEERLDRPPRNVGGCWSHTVLDNVEDQHVAYESVGPKDVHRAPMDNHVFHYAPESSEISHHVVGGPAGGFSGFTRGHILY